MLKLQQTLYLSERGIQAGALDFERVLKNIEMLNYMLIMLLLTPVSSLTSLIAAVQISSPCKWNSTIKKIILK